MSTPLILASPHKESQTPRTCRFCSAELVQSFVDLGVSPLSNAYLQPQQLQQGEMFFPLHAWLCKHCLLVQLEEFETPQTIFSDYAYFSSYSESWLAHAKAYAEAAIKRFKLDKESRVVEIASNDGYLLQYFQQARIPVLGIEPAANVAAYAHAKHIEMVVDFFSVQLANRLVREGKRADLLIGNNVLAHVPNLNDFVAGMKLLLKPGGTISMEFPHLLRLIEQNQFDTIYHEHFSYFSLHTAEQVFMKHGLSIFDVEELPTHGGSLRIYAKHTNEFSGEASAQLIAVRAAEKVFGIGQLETYGGFGARVQNIKYELLEFLIKAKHEGKQVVAYGAPAKGNTLLNYCGIRSDLISYTVDLSPHKQGRYLPGSRIPVHAPEALQRTKPDYIVILAWNLQDEIMQQVSYVREWGARFVIAIPGLKLI